MPAPDAQSLMRSRYSAYVLKLKDYLLASWHPGTRPAKLELETDNVKWLGLDIRNHATNSDNSATVEFVARFKVGGRAQRLHEISRFVREGDRWFYVDGDFPE
jgi:SEC-C motif-containing protein